MKKIKILLISLIMLSFIFLSCSKDSTGPGNAEPGIPSNPNPGDNATDVSVTPILSWECIDPENDTLTYDVYFGNDSTPDSGEIVSEGQSSTDYDPGTLIEASTFFWKIIASDGETETEGNVWNFRTVSSDGCFEWCTVPAGIYHYGWPAHPMNLNYDFQIMKYEVTNQQYVAYLEEAFALGEIWIEGEDIMGYYEGDENYSAGNYAFYDLGTPYGYNYARISWDGNSFIINVPSEYEAGDFDGHPVVMVSWFGAWAFSEYFGFSLPTEHEWEKSARGYLGYDYPWGDNIDGSRANYMHSDDPWDNGTTPVGMYNGQTMQGFQTSDSPSPYGVYDLAGNVSEWTDSWLTEFHIVYLIKRGGGWNASIIGIKVWYFSYTLPSYHFSSTGFRCVIR